MFCISIHSLSSVYEQSYISPCHMSLLYKPIFLCFIFIYGNNIHICLFPSVPLPVEPIVSLGTITATSISLSWSVPRDQMVTTSEVMWQTSSNGGPTARAESEGTSSIITDTSYTIVDLESSTTYIITVTVTNAAGSTTSSPLMVTTGECEHTVYYVNVLKHVLKLTVAQ